MATEKVRIGDSIKLDTDRFEDSGQVYQIVNVSYRVDRQDKYTTAVDLIIENIDGEVLERTVASHQIIKV